MEIKASNLKWEGLGSRRESMVEERWLREERAAAGYFNREGEEGFREIGETTGKKEQI